MYDEQCSKVAEDTFRRILEQYPHLHVERDRSTSLEISLHIPSQPGLKHPINLNLQNHDELHFSVGNFRLEWFPCTEASTVKKYIDAVSGFLDGRYRVLEHYRGEKCVKAELQAPKLEGSWETIGTCKVMWTSFQRREHYNELINV